MFWMRAYPLLGKWEGVGLWNSRVFWALRNSRIPRPSPLTLALVMHMHVSKSSDTVPFFSQVPNTMRNTASPTWNQYGK